MTRDDEILAREAELQRAQLASDVAALNDLLDDCLMFTSFDGSIVTKDDDLALHRSGRLRVTRMDPIERSMLHLDAISVVSSKMAAAAIVDGSPTNTVMRYTRVWQHRSGAWRVVAGHMSAVPA